MRKRIPDEFGRKVLARLVETGMTQAELIEVVKAECNLFLDSGYLYKILTGQRSAPKIKEVITKILDLTSQEKNAG